MACNELSNIMNDNRQTKVTEEIGIPLWLKGTSGKFS